jgi:uncharacterized heparinase superfamily protein
VASRQIARRLARLRAVSAAEIAHRLRYKTFCWFERQAHRRGTLARPDRLHTALVQAIREHARWQDHLLESRFDRGPAFYAGAAEPARTRALFDREYASERAAAIDAADRVLGGEVFFFGQAFPLERRRWNHDPVTRVEWPRRYHRNVPTGEWRTYGDVKYVWELNRHQFLTDLGRAAFLTGDPKYTSAATVLIEDWVADNPYGTGVNWACALEPAFRVFSWLWTYFLCLDHLRSDRESHLLWLTSFYDHGRFLYRHLEHHASPFNHLIGEAAALYMMGVLFPEFADAGPWRRRGRYVLESELPRQFYRDGGSVEQSLFYHHATLGFYTLAAVLGRRNDEEFAPQVWQAIERGMAFSAAFVQPDGSTPSIGGADDGKPLRLEHVPWWDFRAFQAIGTVLFDRREFKCVAGRFPEDAVWLLGADGFERFGAAASGEPAASVALPSSGYYVLRNNRTPEADYVCIDCGEQAGEIRTDAVPNSVHGHADCLSIVLWLGGRRVLVDSGLFCYNGDPDWEGHFRQTAAHNTARIDGRDQALHLGKMAWSYSYTATPELWWTQQQEAAFMGSHDGYTRRGGDTVHRRLVWLRDNYVVVYDEFESAREHDVELNFQFAPGSLKLNAQGTPGTARYGTDVQLAWIASLPLTAVVKEAGPKPDEGWIAPSLGIRVPAPRLTMSGRVAQQAAVMTVFAAPRAGEPLDVSLATVSGAGVGGVIIVRRAGFEDRIAAPTVGTAAAPGETDGRVAIWRLAGNRVVGATQLGGTYVR